MDTLRMMLFALLIGATASTSAYAPSADVSTPPAVTSVQQQGTQTALATQPGFTFVTPFPAASTPTPTEAVLLAPPVTPTPVPSATTRVIDTGTSITRELYRGLEGDDVRMLQKLLDELGYSVSIDGTFGVQTRNAVIQFQRNNGLKADGIAGTRTIRKLVSKEAVRGDGEVKPRTSLSYGMVGEDVLNLQNRLAELGYYADVCSGKYLTNTRNAVRWFQQNNSLSVDGIAGPATLSRVYSRSAIPAGSPSPTPGPIFSRNLYQGLSGTDVTALQQYLYDLGYLSIRPTSFFGNDTYVALQTYQSYNGLYADGIAGKATFDLMLSGRSVPYYPRPTMTPGPLPITTCPYCRAVIAKGQEWMHNTLSVCGVHRVCESGDHDLAACEQHYACSGGIHYLLGCGRHYVCGGGTHNQCINCKLWDCGAGFPPDCSNDPSGNNQHVF